MQSMRILFAAAKANELLFFEKDQQFTFFLQSLVIGRFPRLLSIYLSLSYYSSHEHHPGKRLAQ
jgi:hypothetical protein